VSGAQALAAGLAELGLSLPPSAQGRLLDYLSLLRRWNRTYNLTAVREEGAMVNRHLLDSLAVLPHLPGQRICDVGSGAGLPGIPLALALPQAQVTLLDASEKKAAFLRQAVIELGIENAQVACARVERWDPPARFDIVISRALAPLARFASLASHLVAAGGVLAAMKGADPRAEIEELPAAFGVRSIVPLAVPGVRGARHLVLLEPR
jgi:16S rRNA (guanine527-N7)-methyltransferase